MKTFVFCVRCAAVLAVFLAFSAVNMPAADSTSPAASGMEATNAQEVMRSYLHLQEELHATQLAIEENRKEAREASARSAEALANRLQFIEQALASQRARELESMQSTNRVMVIVAGSFAALGFIAMLLMAYFQWQTVHGLAEISTALPGARALGPGSPLAALGPGDTHLMTGGLAEQSNLRLLGAMEQLEKRLYDLEHASHSPLKAIDEGGSASSNGNHQSGAGKGHTAGAPADGAASGSSEQVATLLGKGQSMLDVGKAEEALACFVEALALEPENTETLVKKGTALEHLQRLDEAIACYDRAIAADGSMTIAYLHKGGLFNRLERFNEALECYEKALKTQEKRAG
jgi:tetratricopeptide (TPR) repeat protein